MKRTMININDPSVNEVEKYLDKWQSLDKYRQQEATFDLLFNDLAHSNDDLRNIMLKSSVLNDFYSTHIMDISTVSKHIFDLNIDPRLKVSDETLVGDIANVNLADKPRQLISFASKYCSHHKPEDYPYDGYVSNVLSYFKSRDKFTSIKVTEFKDYVKFKKAIIDFRSFYGIEKYNLKKVDRYLWQLGKEKFPNPNYSKPQPKTK